MSDTDSGGRHWLAELVDDISDTLLETSNPTPVVDQVKPREFTAANTPNNIVLFHGEEEVARIKPEHGEQLVDELGEALEERRTSEVFDQ